MRNENAFNAWLSKELRTLHSKGFHHAKISDKFTAGVSDFLIWGLGKSVVIESKYVKEFPKDTSDLLEHTFSGAQITFLESIGLTGNRAFGLIAVGDRKGGSLFLIPWKEIPDSGNWKVADFKIGKNIGRYHWDEWKEMIGFALTGEGHSGR